MKSKAVSHKLDFRRLSVKLEPFLRRSSLKSVAPRASFKGASPLNSKNSLIFHNSVYTVLRIRLTRTGRTKQESFRIVVAEHARPVKGKFIEVVGYYQPAKIPKVFKVEKPRVEYWMSKGAQPSSSVAALFKKNGFADMDKYLFTRQRDMKKKGEEAAEAKAAAGAPKASAAPKAEKAAPAEEAKAEAPAETPAA